MERNEKIDMQLELLIKQGLVITGLVTAVLAELSDNEDDFTETVNAITDTAELQIAMVKKVFNK